jgi:hypothetical protein
MKTLTLISLLFCSTVFFANNPKTPPLKISQYNYFDFMDKFALDDTSVVIIDFFLRTHNEKTIGEMSESPLNSTVQATTSGPSPVVNQLPVHKKYLHLKYSKKRLAKTLNKYNNGKGVSKSLSKKIIKHYQVMALQNGN